MHRRILGCAAVRLLTLTLGLALQVGAMPQAALAHAQLLSASPAAGAVLQDAPERIDLTFNENLLDLDDGTRVLVVDADGVDHASGPATVDGATVTAPVGDLPDGHHQVRWRIISADGHPLSGVVPFTVGDVPADAPSPQVAAVVGDDAASSPTTADTEVASDEPATGATSPARPVVIGIAGAGGALLLLGGWTLLRRRHHPHSSPEGEPSTKESP